MKHPVFLSIVALLLGSCNGGTPKIKPADIYSYEAAHYPDSSWQYVGSEGRWHYFNQWTWIAGHDWKLDRKHLPELHGFAYHPKPSTQRKALSADVEIHAEFIRMHIDHYPPYNIPFTSPGFITSQHRTRNRKNLRQDADSPLTQPAAATSRGDR